MITQIPWLQSWLKHASIGQSKTSVLNPVQWLLVILFAGEGLLLWLHAPAWLMIVVGVGIATVLLLFVAAYLYFMRINPDALRSEGYVLSKLALEKRVLGDSITGLHEVITTSVNTNLITETSTNDEAQQK